MKRIVLLVTVAVVLLPQPSAQATFFGDAGDIAFSMLVGEPDREIYNTDIHLVRPDGSNVRRVTDSGFGENNPYFSPDGRHLVYYRDSDGVVIRRRVSGGSERILLRQKVTRTHFWKPFSANWSPDGEKLVVQWQAYDRQADVWAETAIVVIDSDGGNRTTIVPAMPGVTYWQPRWAPDGRHIIFSRPGLDGTVSDIMIVAAEGGEPQVIPTETVYDYLPTWTPDGRIMYVTRPCTHARCSEVRTMSIDGSDVRTLLSLPDLAEDGYPDAVHEAVMSPDGASLLLTVRPTSDNALMYAPWELWRYDLETTEALRLVEDQEGVSDWQPRCTVRGTARNDVLTGTSGRDLICGLGGDDTIRGLGGDDVIFGHGGNDVIVGGAGSDIVVGNSGRDRCDRDRIDFSGAC